MATIIKRTNKDGAASYQIRVSLGRNINSKQVRKFHTWFPAPGMTPKQIEKAVEREAVLFEERCKNGEVLDTKTRFADFAAQWCERNKDEHSPAYQYRVRAVLERVNEDIGHLQIGKITPFHLETLYVKLLTPGIVKTGSNAVSRDLSKIRRERKLTQAALVKLSGLSINSVRAADRGEVVSVETAKKLSEALETPLNRLFIINNNNDALSSVTVREHHRIIGSILESARRRKVISSNPARDVEKLPKAQKKEACFLDEKEAREVVNALSSAPLKWRCAVMLLAQSGMRRGELCGLTWDDIDFENHVVHIRKAHGYLPEMGIYEKETKNASSERVVKLPPEMFALLKEYRAWQAGEQFKSGNLWHLSNKVFTQINGKPIHPSSITQWVAKFRESNKLPYFSPHTLRHTSATLLIMQGVPVKAVSSRLGHASQNTTNKIYSHSIKTVDAIASDILGDILKPIDKKQKSV